MLIRKNLDIYQTKRQCKNTSKTDNVTVPIDN